MIHFEYNLTGFLWCNKVQGAVENKGNGVGGMLFNLHVDERDSFYSLLSPRELCTDLSIQYWFRVLSYRFFVRWNRAQSKRALAKEMDWRGGCISIARCEVTGDFYYPLPHLLHIADDYKCLI